MNNIIIETKMNIIKMDILFFKTSMKKIKFDWHITYLRNNIIIIIFLCLFIFSHLARPILADTLVLDNGKVYEDYYVSKEEPDGLTITHSGGVSKVHFKNLPEYLQKKYNYDPSAGDQYSHERKKELSVLITKQKKAAQKAQLDKDIANALDSIKETSIQAKGKILQMDTNGALVTDARTEFAYQYKEKKQYPANYKPIKEEYLTKTEVRTKNITESNEPIMVLGLKGFVDGESWSNIIYPAGIYSYQTILGARKTVACYALSPEDALDYMLKNEGSFLD